MSIHTTNIFEVSESSCCKGRIRVRLGSKKLCLDWKEAKAASRALRQMADRLKPTPTKSSLDSKDGGRRA